MLTSVDMITIMGDALGDFETTIATVLSQHLQGDEGAARTFDLLRQSTVCRKCRARETHGRSQLLRVEEDVSKVPKMALVAYAEQREVLVVEHPDVLMTDNSEPHLRFLSCLS